MDADPIVSRRAGLVEAEVDGEIVALHVDQGTCYGFNATATRVWKLIEQPRRLSEIRAALAEEYEVDARTCEDDLRDLLRQLEADELVSLEPAAG